MSSGARHMIHKATSTIFRNNADPNPDATATPPSTSTPTSSLLPESSGQSKKLRKSKSLIAAVVDKVKETFNMGQDEDLLIQPSDSVLAFRTITTLLALVQEREVTHPGGEHTSPEKEKENTNKELKISNAISTIAIADYEIVAVSTRRTPRDIDMVACAQPSEDVRAASSKDSLDHPGFLFRILGWIFIKNGRADDPQDPKMSIFPTIENITATDDGKELATDAELLSYLEANMTPLKEPTTISLAAHIYILKKILTIRTMNAFQKSEVLRRRVVAMCYPKILRRLQNQILSQPYISSLKSVKDFTFTRGNKPDPASLQGKRQLLNDQLLLQCFVSERQGQENLYAQRQLAMAGEPFELYTEATCMEYHQLLLELLARFEKDLKALSKSGKKFKNGTSTAADLPIFRGQLECVLFSGFALQRIAGGSAFEIHLTTIESHLCDLRIHSQNAASDNDDLEEFAGVFASDAQTELAQTQTQLWESYANWFQRTLVHFDAVEILVDYFCSDASYNGENISAHILVSPPVDNQMLSLKDLLLKYLPSDPDSSKTNQQIIEFFTSISKPEFATFHNTIKIIDGIWKNRSSPLVIRVRSVLRELSKILEQRERVAAQWPVLGQGFTALFTAISTLTSPGSNHREDDISDMIELLKLNVDLIAGLSTSCNLGFRGALHCEACLASLLENVHVRDNIDPKYKAVMEQMLGYGRVIGVSKRCCPACFKLLSLLTQGTEDPFIVRGSHNTVSACTLPTWLPDHIVDDMNTFFGKELRKELVKIMGRSELARVRAQSVSSARLSLSSDRPGQSSELQDRLALQAASFDKGKIEAVRSTPNL